MHSQATRTTQKQLAYLAYWQARGYRFGHNELAPENTVTPPSFANRHPVADALAGGLILAFGFGGLLAYLIAVGSGLA